MRCASVDQLVKRDLDKLIQPVIWNYGSILAFPTGMLERYQTVWGNKGTWAGTAWRGATGSHVCVTTIRHHVDNHLAWLSVMREMPDLVAGWIMTGWARYCLNYRVFNKEGQKVNTYIKAKICIFGANMWSILTTTC